MKSKLKNTLDKILLGTTVIGSLIGGELEDKIKISKKQNEKIIVYNREIISGLMDYSFVKNNQTKIYETSQQNITEEDKKQIQQLKNRETYFRKNLSQYLENKTNTYLTINKNSGERYSLETRTGGRHDLTELQSRRIPNSEEFFREDSKNTHIYFVYPPTSKLEILSQELEVLNNKTEQTRKINTQKYEDTEFYKYLATISDLLDIYEAVKPLIHEEYNQDLDSWRINNLGYNQEMSEKIEKNKKIRKSLPENNPQVKIANKIPGRTGQVVKTSIFFSKVLMEEIQKQNILKFWEKGLSEDWNVLEMPLFVGEDINPLTDNIVSRKTNFKISGEFDKYYIVISSLPYYTGVFETQTSGIEDVLIEIEK